MIACNFAQVPTKFCHIVKKSIKHVMSLKG